MDISSIVIGLVLLLVFIGPIGYLLVKQKTTSKNKIKRLMALAQKNQLSLSETEILPTVSLGLDVDLQTFVAIQHGKYGKESIIDLSKFVSSDIFDSSSNGHSAENYNSSEEIRLLLKGKPGTPDESFLLFHDDFDSIIAKEERLRSAKQWQERLRGLLKK